MDIPTIVCLDCQFYTALVEMSAQSGFFLDTQNDLGFCLRLMDLIISVQLTILETRVDVYAIEAHQQLSHTQVNKFCSLYIRGKMAAKKEKNDAYNY